MLVSLNEIQCCDLMPVVSQPVFEGCTEVGAIMCEEVAESADPESPVPHAYFAMVGPVVFCFAVRVSFPPVCVWAEFESTCVCYVGESDNLEFFPAPVHLIVKLVCVWASGFLVLS